MSAKSLRSFEDLQDALKDDIKVKVAGENLGEYFKHALISLISLHYRRG